MVPRPPTRRSSAPAFADRADAGRQLAAELRSRIHGAPVMLGLPRGGVVVAAAVAEELGLTVDVLVVMKLGVPGRPELGLGAVGEGGVLVLNDRIVAQSGLGPAQLHELEARSATEVARRAAFLRADRPQVCLVDRSVVVVDDGIATGATARAACLLARQSGAVHVTLAAPVAPRDVGSMLGDVVDDLVCLLTPSTFSAVSVFYEDFAPVSEAEVRALLAPDVPRS